MNPHASQSVSPLNLLNSLWQYRALIYKSTEREVAGRYKGSVVGVGWSFLLPILMLCVYTFVFSFVFEARWGVDNVDTAGGKADFAVVLFVGLIVHALFAEVINRSPTMILDNANYVKKVIYPLEILPVAALGAALFHSLISILVLFVVLLAYYGFVHWTTILYPFVLMPLLPLTLGASWFLASLGVFLRDVSQVIGVITTILLFLAPVFYPLERLPEAYQIALMFNPLTFIIMETRKVLIFGQMPDWSGLAVYMAISCIIAWLGYFWFQKTRKGFADVL